MERLIKAIEENFEELMPGSVNPETRFEQLIVWNSFNALVIYTIVKEEFGIEVPWADFKNLHTVSELHAYILQIKGL